MNTFFALTRWIRRCCGVPPAAALFAGLLALPLPRFQTPPLRPLRGPLRPLLPLPCQRLPLPLSSLLRALRRL
jgi:hypothetical protein